MAIVNMTHYERLELLAKELDEFYFEQIYDLWFERYGTKRIPPKTSIPKMLMVSRKIQGININGINRMVYFWIGE